MTINTPPRFVVRPADSPEHLRLRLYWLGGLWLASLLVVAALVYLATDRGPLASPARSQQRDLAEENATLKQQVAVLKRSEQVAGVATNELRGSLAEREEEINGLRADLAFYSRLVGGGAQRESLQMQNVHLDPVAGAPRAWDLTLTLTQNARRGKDIEGSIDIHLDGVHGSTLQRLDWSQLGGKAHADGLAFSFKYFEQIHGTLILPEHFNPTRLRITITPKGGKPLNRSVAWADARKDKAEDDNVQP